MRPRIVMNRSSLALGVLALSCLAAISGCAREHQSVILFYEAICPSCEESRRMELLAGSVLGLGSAAKFSAQAFNLYEHGGWDALEEALESAGRESSGVSFPLLIVGHEVHEGEAAVREEIERLREGATLAD